MDLKFAKNLLVAQTLLVLAFVLLGSHSLTTVITLINVAIFAIAVLGKFIGDFIIGKLFGNNSLPTWKSFLLGVGIILAFLCLLSILLFAGVKSNFPLLALQVFIASFLLISVFSGVMSIFGAALVTAGEKIIPLFPHLERKELLQLSLLTLFAILLTVCLFNDFFGIFVKKLDDRGATPAGIEAAVQSNNQFTFDLYSQYKSQEGNIFFSPYGISMAFAMAYEGARGKTAQEIENVFHFQKESTIRQPAFARIYNQLNQYDREYELRTANALWANKEYPFLEQYFNTIEKYYGGKATNLDFESDSEGSRRTINGWIEKMTNNKIKDMAPSGTITPDTGLVITNAIYFKGKWETQFKKEATREEDFRVTSERKVKVSMMRIKASDEHLFNYGETEDLQCLEMDYIGEDISMLILLPKDDSLETLEQSLNAEVLQEIKRKMEEREVHIYFPRFKFETKYSMEDTFKKMGMEAPFEWPGADFSGMDGTKLLYIEKVLHNAFVEANEEGTEAAAATFMSGGIGAMMQSSIFRADHPFIFIIQDKTTGTILFLGRVSDPTKS